MKIKKIVVTIYACLGIVSVVSAWVILPSADVLACANAATVPVPRPGGTTGTNNTQEGCCQDACLAANPGSDSDMALCQLNCEQTPPV